MKIVVDSQQTKQAVLSVCAAAGQSCNLSLMQAAVIIAESVKVQNGHGEIAGNQRAAEGKAEGKE